jgi:hypothetical protein
MTDDYTTPNPPPPEDDSDSTRAGSPTPHQPRGRRELPRRGYENQPRPVNPPMPQPLTSEQQRPPRNVSSAKEQSARRTTAPPEVNAPRPRRRRLSKSDSGLYLPWWSLLILIIVAGVAAFGVLGFVLSLGGDPLGDQPAQVVIVTNANEPTAFNAGGGTGEDVPANALVITFTPGGVPTNEVIAPTPVPVADPTETPLPGVTSGCPLNALVTVTGTGTVGLSIRSQPRQGNNITSVAREGETLRIVGGPENSTGVDGATIEWCQIEGVDVDTPDRSGWAARSFLAEIGFEEGN